jgi:hypothetical protein
LAQLANFDLKLGVGHLVSLHLREVAGARHRSAIRDRGQAVYCLTVFRPPGVLRLGPVLRAAHDRGLLAWRQVPAVQFRRAHEDQEVMAVESRMAASAYRGLHCDGCRPH